MRRRESKGITSIALRTSKNHFLSQSSNAQTTRHRSASRRVKVLAAAFFPPASRASHAVARAPSPGCSENALSLRLGAPPPSPPPPRHQSTTPRTARPLSSRLFFLHRPTSWSRYDLVWSGAEDTRRRRAETLSDEVPEVRICWMKTWSAFERPLGGGGAEDGARGARDVA